MRNTLAEGTILKCIPASVLAAVTKVLWYTPVSHNYKALNSYMPAPSNVLAFKKLTPMALIAIGFLYRAIEKTRGLPFVVLDERRRSGHFR